MKYDETVFLWISHIENDKEGPHAFSVRFYWFKRFIRNFFLWNEIWGDSVFMDFTDWMGQDGSPRFLKEISSSKKRFGLICKITKINKTCETTLHISFDKKRVWLNQQNLWKHSPYSSCLKTVSDKSVKSVKSVKMCWNTFSLTTARGPTLSLSPEEGLGTHLDPIWSKKNLISLLNH